VTRTTASRDASEPAALRSDAKPHFTGAFADYNYLQPGHYVLRTPDALDDFLDRIAERLQLARAFGADHAVNVDDFATSAARAKAVRDLTGGGGHVVLELVGHPSALPEGIAMARAEGCFVVIGNIAADQTIPFNPAWLAHLNRRMIGVGGYQAWALRRGLELLERTRDRYLYGAILSHRYPLERINEAFANADQGKAGRTALICAPELVGG